MELRGGWFDGVIMNGGDLRERRIVWLELDGLLKGVGRFFDGGRVFFLRD